MYSLSGCFPTSHKLLDEPRQSRQQCQQHPVEETRERKSVESKTTVSDLYARCNAVSVNCRLLLVRCIRARYMRWWFVLAWLDDLSGVLVWCAVEKVTSYKVQAVPNTNTLLDEWDAKEETCRNV